MKHNAEEHVLDRDDKTRGTAYETQDEKTFPVQSPYKCGVGTGGSSAVTGAGAGAGAGNFAGRNSQKPVLQRLCIADMIGC